MKKQESKQRKRRLVLAMLLVLAMSLGTVPAYANTPVYCNGIRWWNVGPTYGSWNEGMHNQLGYAAADCWSTMKIWCEERGVQAGAIHAWAGLTKTDSLARQTMYWGPEEQNWGSLGQGQNVIANHELRIWSTDSGSAWGYGTVRSADLSIHEVNSENLFLIYVPIQPWFGASSNSDASIVPYADPENDDFTRNFTGPDGLVYGVPYEDANGNVMMPDMGRVLTTDGQIGYMSLDMLVDESCGGDNISSWEELAQMTDELADQKALALKQAFAEYSGVDALDFETAYECVTELSLNGDEACAAIIENDVAATLAKAVNDNVVSSDIINSIVKENAIISAESASVQDKQRNNLRISEADVEISEEAFDAILELARPSVALKLPVYASDGVTVIGECSINRF